MSKAREFVLTMIVVVIALGLVGMAVYKECC
jgi:hypothetical protein